MGLINLPNVDDIVSEKNPKLQMEMLINTVGILMKNLRELNGYMNSKNIFEVGGWRTSNGKLSSEPGVYPYVELDPKGKLLGAFKDEFNSLAILPITGPNIPAIRFYNSESGNASYIYYDSDVGEMIITAQGDLIIGATGDVIIKGKNISTTLNSLQSQIDNLDARVTALGG